MWRFNASIVSYSFRLGLRVAFKLALRGQWPGKALNSGHGLFRLANRPMIRRYDHERILDRPDLWPAESRNVVAASREHRTIFNVIPDTIPAINDDLRTAHGKSWTRTLNAKADAFLNACTSLRCCRSLLKERRGESMRSHYSRPSAKLPGLSFEEKKKKAKSLVSYRRSRASL